MSIVVTGRHVPLLGGAIVDLSKSILKMTNPIPKLKPLIADLKELDLPKFLKSNIFRRLTIKMEIADFWDSMYRQAEKNRTFYSVGMETQHENKCNWIMPLFRFCTEILFK